MRIMCLLALLLLPFSTAHAQLLTPEDGVWWNPAESGRGFVIETQNGIMVITAYVYEAGGNQLWYTSAGNFNLTTRRFSGTLDSTRGGQCLGCSYRAPVPGPSAGAVTIQFTSNATAILSAGGVTIPLQRFIYGYALPDGYVFGGWIMSQQTATLVTADWLVFNRTTPASSGNPFVTGNRDLDPASIVVGRFSTPLGKHLYLLDSSVSFWRAYEFDMNKRNMVGRSWLYPKGTEITGPGVVFAGARLFDRYELSTASIADTGKRLAQAALDEIEWSSTGAKEQNATTDAAVRAELIAIEREFLPHLEQ